jgi:hypothetical protein
MGISAEQRKALEAAGYTVSGKTVKTKDGKSIGGYNENGKIWSGSNKVKDILKGGAKPSPKKEDNKPASKPARRTAKAAEAENLDDPNGTQWSHLRRSGGARPEGKATGLPAAKKATDKKAVAAAAAAAGATRLARSLGTGVSGGIKPPSRPASTPKAQPARPQLTQRPVPYTPPSNIRPAAGGGRAVGGAIRPRGPGGKGATKLPDILELKLMNKGGLVTKGKK